ncbi:hypothetical protein D3C83_159880 [compost metagenome]
MREQQATRDGRDDQQLADLDAEIEREQRPAKRRLRQSKFLQHVCEAEAVNQAEGQGEPRPQIGFGSRGHRRHRRHRHF